WINDLKLRASWGKLGFSDVLGSWDYFSVVNVFPRAIYGTNQGVYQGGYQSIVTNPDLHWETRIQKNVGFDATVFENRLSLSFDVYNATSQDVLVNLPIALYTGSNRTFRWRMVCDQNCGHLQEPAGRRCLCGQERKKNSAERQTG